MQGKFHLLEFIKGKSRDYQSGLLNYHGKYESVVKLVNKHHGKIISEFYQYFLHTYIGTVVQIQTYTVNRYTYQ